MRITDYYLSNAKWYTVPSDKAVYPVVLVEEDMGNTREDDDQKRKRASEAYREKAKKFPEKILTPKGPFRPGIGVFLSIWV